MTDSVSSPQTFEELLRAIEKRFRRQERRPTTASVADVLGPGMGMTAMQVYDWNSEEAVINGFVYSYPESLNSPDGDLPWTGQVIARADGTGMQQVWNTDDPENMRYWVRTYSPTPGDEENVTFTDWVKFASPSGWVDETVIEPSIITDIETALATAEEAMGFVTVANKTFRQTTAPVDTVDWELREGDVWFDTDDDNQPYWYNGTAWVSIRDLQIEAALDAAAAALAAASDATADAEAAMDFAETKTQVYRQTTSPTHTGAAGTGVWFDTDDGNKMYVWTGAAWTDATTAWVDTNIATSFPGIQISPTGLTALDAAGVATFNIAAATGAVVMKGSLTSGSDITGATITGGTVQSEATAARGIKMNSTGLTAYNASGVPTLTITAATGAIAMLGDLTSGSTVSGATVTGGTLQSEATAARGVKITSTGLVVYNTSGTVVFSALASGTVTMTGALQSGSTIDGTVLTGGTVQTEATASRGIKMNSSGLTAYDGSGNPTLTITASTGAIVMKGDLSSGSTITGATITGGSFQTATTGNRLKVWHDAPYSTISFYSSLAGDTGGYIRRSSALIPLIEFDTGTTTDYDTAGHVFLAPGDTGGFAPILDVDADLDIEGVAVFQSNVTVQGEFSASQQLQGGTKATGTFSAINTDKTVTQNLPVTMPDNNYYVGTSIRDSANSANKTIVITNKTTTSFDIIARRSSGTATFDVDWVVFRPRP